MTSLNASFLTGKVLSRHANQHRRAPRAQVREREKKTVFANASVFFAKLPKRIHLSHRSLFTYYTPSLHAPNLSLAQAGRVLAAKEGRQSLFVTVTVKEGKMKEYEEVSKTKRPCDNLVCNQPSTKNGESIFLPSHLFIFIPPHTPSGSHQNPIDGYKISHPRHP